MKPLAVRSAAISGYAELARAHGLEPAKLLRQVGLSPGCLRSPDIEIPARKAYRLLEQSAQASGLGDFGLRLAHKRGLSHFGPLGLLVRDEPNLRAALAQIQANMSLHSTCASLDLQEGKERAVVVLTLLADGEPVIRQSTESAIGLLFQMLSNLLGPGWHPIAVQFMHPKGTGDANYRVFFRCPVLFSSNCNAIVMRRTDLDQPMPGSDIGFRRYAWPSTSAHGDPVGAGVTPARVRQIILTALPQGQCSSTHVARLLDIDRRTLHRHLTAHGTRFSDLMTTVRLDLIRQYLDAGHQSMSEIATLLGFNSLSSSSRWARRCLGCAPSSLRQSKIRPFAR